MENLSNLCCEKCYTPRIDENNSLRYEGKYFCGLECFLTWLTGRTEYKTAHEYEEKIAILEDEIDDLKLKKMR